MNEYRSNLWCDVVPHCHCVLPSFCSSFEYEISTDLSCCLLHLFDWYISKAPDTRRTRAHKLSNFSGSHRNEVLFFAQTYRFCWFPFLRPLSLCTLIDFNTWTFIPKCDIWRQHDSCFVISQFILFLFAPQKFPFSHDRTVFLSLVVNFFVVFDFFHQHFIYGIERKNFSLSLSHRRLILLGLVAMR